MVFWCGWFGGVLFVCLWGFLFGLGFFVACFCLFGVFVSSIGSQPRFFSVVPIKWVCLVGGFLCVCVFVWVFCKQYRKSTKVFQCCANKVSN